MIYKVYQNSVKVKMCNMDLRLTALTSFSNVWCHVNEAKQEL